MAWLGGLPGPHPSWAAASIPPQLSHWLGSGLPLRPCPLLGQPISLSIYPQLQADWEGTTPVGAVGFYKVTSHPRASRLESRGSLAGRGEDICKNNYRGF